MTRWSYPTALTAPSYQDQQAVPRAISWVREHLQPGQRAVVWTPSKPSLRSDPRLEAFAKANAAVTSRTRNVADWYRGPVLAGWPGPDDLGQLAEDGRVTALCVIPHALEEVAAWAAVADPVHLGAGPGPMPATAPLDPVVVEGLKALSSMVNHGNQLAGSMDRRDAVAVLTALSRAGHVLEPAGIYGWAIANGWPARGAKRLRELAEQLRGGRTVRAPGSGSVLRADIVDKWQQAAAGPKD